MSNLTIKNLRGLDSSSSIYECAPNHLVESDNFICEGGINRKRPGLTEIAKLPGQINGIFPYSEGSKQICIVHSADKLYRVELSDSATTSVVTLLTLPEKAEILNARSYAVNDKGALFILCGDYLVYRNCGSTDKPEYRLQRVLNNKDFTYIPTTTISIDAEGADEKIRTDFEAANLLTKYRINMMQGMPVGTENNELNNTYYLDTGITLDSVVVVKAERLINGETLKEEYRNNPDSINGAILYKISANGELTNEAKGRIASFTLGKIIFNEPIISANSIEDCIEVTFETTQGGLYYRITGCAFGTQFGLGGNNDRLFLAGNSEYPNMDFYSESNNYTYFADKNYTVLGGEHSVITGYSRINDGSLGIHKSKGDASGIYYRSSANETYTDAATGASINETVFPISAGAIGQYCISPDTCLRLDDDPLFLSDCGIYATTLGNSITTNERYAKERSGNIARELSSNPMLKHALAAVADGRYYLYAGDTAYVADSRYKYSNQEVKSDTFNYEWWRWRLGVTITATSVIDNRTVLGASDGRIFRYGGRKYDVRYDLFASGDSSIDYADNLIVLSETAYNRLFHESGEETLITLFGDINNLRCDGIVASGKEFIAIPADNYKIRLYSPGKSESVILSRSNAAASVNERIARIIKKPIHARMVTPVFDLGTSEHFKSINRITVSVDNTELNEFYITAKSRSGEKNVKIVQTSSFDFNNIDFDSFVFPVALFAQSNISQLKQRNINYLQLIIDSDNDKECALSAVTIDYTLNQSKIHGGIY